MRVLIYSETQAAKAKQAELRSEGHHASIRNPQYFNPAQFDKACDLVLADDPAILTAYACAEAGIEVERIGPVLEPEPAPAIDEAPPIADEPAPPDVSDPLADDAPRKVTRQPKARR